MTCLLIVQSPGPPRRRHHPALVTRQPSKVRLAAAVRLRIAVALELVAGQTWAPLQPGRDCGTHCPSGTVYTECVRDTDPAASRLSVHARPVRLGASAQADSEPVLRISASAIL